MLCLDAQLCYLLDVRLNTATVNIENPFTSKISKDYINSHLEAWENSHVARAHPEKTADNPDARMSFVFLLVCVLCVEKMSEKFI